MIRQCLVCSKDFVTYPSKVKIGRGKYCSKKCCLTITAIEPGLGAAALRGKKPHNYRGWRYAGRGRKYRLVHRPDHPSADGCGYIREHRLVAEQKYGRIIESWEDVHHIDGNGLNNHPDNLVVMGKREHLELEHKNGRYTEHLNSLHANSKISGKTKDGVVHADES